MKLKEVTRLLCLDTETTGVDVWNDRIVTYSLVDFDETKEGYRTDSLLLNPGVPIPAGATAVHGITTEKAQEFGDDPKIALEELKCEIEVWWDEAGMPLVGSNLPYDLTILAAECERHELGEFKVTGPVLDTMVLHRMYSGQRKATLAIMGEYYGVENKDAHTSEADAIATLDILRKMIAKFPALGEQDLRDLYVAQRQAHRAWAADMQRFFNRIGKRSERVNGEWPIMSR